MKALVLSFAVAYNSPGSKSRFLKAFTPMPLTAGTRLGPYELLNAIGASDVTRDGQRFLLNLSTEEAASSPLTVVLNWTATLKK